MRGRGAGGGRRAQVSTRGRTEASAAHRSRKTWKGTETWERRRVPGPGRGQPGWRVWTEGPGGPFLLLHAHPVRGPCSPRREVLSPHSLCAEGLTVSTEPARKTRPRTPSTSILESSWPRPPGTTTGPWLCCVTRLKSATQRSQALNLKPQERKIRLTEGLPSHLSSGALLLFGAPLASGGGR